MTFRSFDSGVLKRIIPGFIYANTIELVKRRLLYFVDYKGVKKLASLDSESEGEDENKKDK